MVTGLIDKCRIPAGQHAFLVIMISIYTMAVWCCFSLRDWPFDDALIHARIATHLQNYGAPRFNLHENILSTSSLIWTGLLAVASKLCGPTYFSKTVWLVESLSLVAGAHTWLWVLKKSIGEISGLSALIFVAAYIGLLLDAAVGCMETPLAFMILGSACAMIIKRSLIGFALLALSPLCRIEALAFALPIIVMMYAVSGRTSPRASFATFFMILICECVILFWNFGSLVPHTSVAKSIVYNLNPYDVWKQVGRPLGGCFKDLGFMFILFPFICFAYYYASIRKRLKPLCQIDAKMLIATCSYCIAVFVIAAYCLGGALIFPWYVPIYGVPLALTHFLISITPQPSLLRLGSRLVSLIWLVAIAMNAMLTILAAFGQRQTWPRFEETARVTLYRKVGKCIQERFPQATVMSAEIGGLGVEFFGPIADALGLATPEALKFHPMPVPAQRKSKLLGSIPPALAVSLKPDIIVAYDVFAEDLMRSDVRLQYAVFQCGALLPSDLLIKPDSRVFGGEHLLILVRDGLASPSAFDICGCSLLK